MPMTISTGLSKKVGTANFGSVGATCNVTFEADHNLLEHDLDGFHQRVKSAFIAARQAVNDQLARELDGTADNSGHAAPATNGASSNGAAHANGHNGNGNATNGGGHANGNGRAKPNGRRATSSQIRAIHAIANRLGLDLASTLQERFGIDHPEDLAISQASELIDSLKAETNGTGGRR